MRQSLLFYSFFLFFNYANSKSYSGHDLKNTSVQAACLPGSNESKDWPISAIYLHGYHKESGYDLKNFRELELSNREKLMSYAIKHKIKIALPVAAKFNNSGFRTWTGYNLNQVETLAQNACNGSKFADKMLLVGFSDGGYLARRASLNSKKGDDCGASISKYASIIAIGAPAKKIPNPIPKCGKFKNSSAHSFPGNFNINNEFAKVAAEAVQTADLLNSREPKLEDENHTDHLNLIDVPASL